MREKLQEQDKRVPGMPEDGRKVGEPYLLPEKAEREAQIEALRDLESRSATLLAEIRMELVKNISDAILARANYPKR